MLNLFTRTVIRPLNHFLGLIQITNIQKKFRFLTSLGPKSQHRILTRVNLNLHHGVCKTRRTGDQFPKGVGAKPGPKWMIP